MARSLVRKDSNSSIILIISNSTSFGAQAYESPLCHPLQGQVLLPCVLPGLRTLLHILQIIAGANQNRQSKGHYPLDE